MTTLIEDLESAACSLGADQLHGRGRGGRGGVLRVVRVTAIDAISGLGSVSTQRLSFPAPAWRSSTSRHPFDVAEAMLPHGLALDGHLGSRCEDGRRSDHEQPLPPERNRGFDATDMGIRVHGILFGGRGA